VFAVIEPFQAAKKAWIRDYWEKALAAHGSVRAAARAANVNRTYANRLLNKLGLKSPQTRHARRGNWGDA
jgi:hypothetical protein